MLILAREFASNLAMPIYIADADETLVYFNESGREDRRAVVRRDRRDARPPLDADAPAARRRRLGGEPRGDARGHRLSTSVGRPTDPCASPGSTAPSARLRRPRCRCSGPRASSTGSWSSSGRHRPRMRVKIWGCRGSLATPGPETLAHRREHDVRRDVGERDPRHLRRRYRAPRARPRARRRRLALDPHLPHPPPSRPHRGARVLRAVLRPDSRGLRLGPAVLGADAEGADQPLSVVAAFPDRGLGSAGAGVVP